MPSSPSGSPKPDERRPPPTGRASTATTEPTAPIVVVAADVHPECRSAATGEHRRIPQRSPPPPRGRVRASRWPPPLWSTSGSATWSTVSRRSSRSRRRRQVRGVGGRRVTGFANPETRAAEDAYWAGLETERQAAEERIARLAELYDQPAVGHYRRQGHRPPPYPADALPLPAPSRQHWTPAQLAAEARFLAREERKDRGIAAEVIVAVGRRCGLAQADIVDALRELLI